MSYTHVIVKMKPVGKNKPITHVEPDLDEDFVVKNIITPYVNNSDVFVEGSRIRANDVEKITVFYSDEDGETLLQKASDRMAASSNRMASQGVFMAGGFATMLMAVQGEGTVDITRKVFNQAQGL